MERSDLPAILSLIIGTWVTVAISVLTYQDWDFRLRFLTILIVSVISAISILTTNFIILPSPIMRVEPLNLVKGGKLASSQFIGISWAKIGSHRYELHADFGVIHVTARHGNFFGCKAKVRIRTRIYQTDSKTGITRPEYSWRSVGDLNWHSDTLKQNIAQLEVFEFQKIGAYLKNPLEDIYENESADLLLCYTIPHYEEGKQRINIMIGFICSDIAFPDIGMMNNAPLEFRAEITLTAQQYRKTICLFDVKMTTDGIEIKNVS